MEYNYIFWYSAYFTYIGLEWSCQCYNHCQGCSMKVITSCDDNAHYFSWIINLMNEWMSPARGEKLQILRDASIWFLIARLAKQSRIPRALFTQVLKTKSTEVRNICKKTRGFLSVDQKIEMGENRSQISANSISGYGAQLNPSKYSWILKKAKAHLSKPAMTALCPN